MNRLAIRFPSALLSLPLLFISACSQQPVSQASSPAPSAPAATEATPSVQPAQPSSTSAPAQPASSVNVSTAAPSGPKATEAHTLSVTDYAKVAVTVSLNGAWVGQWDSSNRVPLDTVVQGKNELKVDVPQKPDNTLIIDIYARRGQQDVSLLSISFQGKQPGSYTYYFVAR
ncbi:MAG: hypothetical protein WCE61_14610 [Candidatus Acidiferrum sp.]